MVFPIDAMFALFFGQSKHYGAASNRMRKKETGVLSVTPMQPPNLCAGHLQQILTCPESRVCPLRCCLKRANFSQMDMVLGGRPLVKEALKMASGVGKGSVLGCLVSFLSKSLKFR